jgi:colicin import membrane protein
MKYENWSHPKPKFSLPFVISASLHVGIVVLIILISPVSSYRLNPSSPNSQPVVHAQVIDAGQVAEQIQNIQSREEQQQQKVRELQEAAAAAQQKKLAEEQRLAQIRVEQQEALRQQQLAAQQAQAEQKRVALLKAQQLQQAQALALAQKQQQEAQAKALELKKQQEAQALELKKQQEAQAKAVALKKQQEADEKALTVKKQQDQEKTLAQKKHQEELITRQNALQEQMMRQQIASEQQQLVLARQMQGIIDQYRARILMAIGNQWLIPEGADPTISCLFTIDLTPAGVVSHATLVRSSGNPALDRSAETAIYKASPLPVPQDPSAFAPFRHFTLKMTPQDIAH